MRLLINQYRNMAFNLEKIDSLYRDGCFIDVVYERGDEVIANYDSGEMAKAAFDRIIERAGRDGFVYVPTEEEMQIAGAIMIHGKQKEG